MRMIRTGSSERFSQYGKMSSVELVAYSLAFPYSPGKSFHGMAKPMRTSGFFATAWSVKFEQLGPCRAFG